MSIIFGGLQTKEEYLFVVHALRLIALGNLGGDILPALFIRNTIHPNFIHS